MLILVALLLQGCGSGSGETETDSGADNVVTSSVGTSAETEAETVEIDLKAYRIINDSSGKKAVSSAMNIFSRRVGDIRALAAYTSGTFTEYTNELHFGLRARDDERAAGLNFRDYRIVLEADRSLSVSAVSIYGLVYAAKALNGLIDADGVLALPGDTVTGVYEYENTEAGRKLAEYENADGRMLVMSHRGDFANNPENSLPAFESCISGGVDIIETDIVKTASGSYMLMHDKTVDRTTTGKGNIADLTDSELKSLKLKTGSGGSGSGITKYGIPFFSDMLEICRGRILINMDKFDASSRADVYELLVKYGMVDYAVFKGGDAFGDLDKWFADFIDAGKQLPTFSTMIYASKPEDAKSKLTEYYGYTAMAELGCSSFNKGQQISLCDFCKTQGIRPMVLTIAASYNGLGADSESVWHQLDIRGFSVLMTNQPLAMASFFSKK